MESVGFKEWALVCEALGRGEQSVLVRKGGIAEGRDGFGFRHSEFFLLPTFFHEQVEKVRLERVELPTAREGVIEIRYFAKLVAQKEITSRPVAAALERFHILHESVVRERFDYKPSGLHVALVRVFRLAPTWSFPDAARYGGCRSWVPLPECPEGTQFEPALTGREHERLLEEFNAAVLEPGSVIPAPGATLRRAGIGDPGYSHHPIASTRNGLSAGADSSSRLNCMS